MTTLRATIRPHLDRLPRRDRSFAGLARAMGITPQTLATILSDGNPRLSTLLRIAHALGITVGNLLRDLQNQA